MPEITHLDYLHALQTWIPSTGRHMHRLPAAPGCMCYGLASHAHWAMQANNTALSAFAVLATDPATDSEVTGMSRDELLDTALSLLRFALQGHQSGCGACTDGERWGHSWISVLCIERMMHAIEALEPHLGEKDQVDLRRMLVSESDWLTDEYEIVAGTVENNKPESNMWNGTLLHRTALMFPDTPRASEYRDKGTRFLVNAISVPSDADRATMVDGLPLRDRHVGANFFESYACNHHAYLNVGYMVITLSNAAMLHFTYRHRGQHPPEALYLHLPELWQLVKTCTFPDGRLLRIGGDTRVRYCYCQDYAIPMWLMMRDKYGETDVEPFEEGWLAQVCTEVAAGEDGAFLGRRLAPMAAASPLYYTRLEGDRAASLSMGAYWRRRYDEFRTVPASTRQTALLPEWHDEYHGACLVRGNRRVASWVWRAAEPPQGLCLPPDASNMAEWRTNLAGRISGTGMMNTSRLVAHSESACTGGFVTCGRIITRSEQHCCEGDLPADIAVEDIAFAALPDDRTIIGIQRARAIRRAPLTEIKGLLLQVPNDLYNGQQRNYIGEKGRVHAASCSGTSESRDAGRWLNVDERLGVLSLSGGEDGTLRLHLTGHRQVTIRSGDWRLRARYGEGALCADEICLGACSETLTWAEPDEVLFDIAFALRTDSSATDTEAWAARTTVTVNVCHATAADVRSATVSADDGHIYALIANFSDQSVNAQIAVDPESPMEPVQQSVTMTRRDGLLLLPIAPHTAELVRTVTKAKYSGTMDGP